MSGDVKVDPAELDAKAAQISEPPPAAPGQPLPPCALQVAVDAVAELNKSAAMLVGYAASGQAEATRLAETFRSAAVAYRQIDEQAGAALDHGETAPGIPPVQPAPPTTPSVPLPADPAYQCHAAPMVMLEQAAAEIEMPDQAASLETFKSNWETYAAALEARSAHFDPAGMTWDGGAAEAAFAALQRHRDWLGEMAAAARELAGQAGDLAAVHRSAKDAHPKLADVTELDARIMSSTDATQRMTLMQYRQALQAESEHILGQYAGKAVMKPIEPPKPPICTPTPPASTRDKMTKNKRPRDDDEIARKNKTSAGGGGQTAAGGGSGSGAGGGGGSQQPAASAVPPSPAGDVPVSPAAATGGQPSGGGAPAGGASPAGGGAPAGGGGAPAGGGSGGGMGGLPGLPDLGGGPPTDLPQLDDPELNPASAGGGGGSGGGSGGGGGGAGPMPLQPNVGSVSVGPAPGQAGGAAAGPSVGGAAPGGGMMGGMGGMAPMHGAGQNQGGQEKKRSPGVSPDETLYEEDRPWTEAVIGNRPRRRESVEGKDKQ